ncbi:TIR domain-containing protein [Fusicatenibacter sp. CLA-AA-H241]|jgi:hypothetical protein|nr:TIR domain-containing protein [Oliverpabstia intestinalis]MCC2195384.1 TIR domain-containing protein [Oliverpabstia intestinalis]
MPSLYDYRIFISHAWKYGDDYIRLVNLLDAAPYFHYFNYSAPEQKPLFPSGTPYTSSDIARKITDKIRPAQITLVISGMYAAYSDWMQYEIDESLRMRMPVIGIMPRGQERVPLYVRDRVDVLVGWNTSSIVSAIRRYV